MATAVVAALVALVGVLIGAGALDLDMAVPPLLPLGGSFAVRYAITAAVLALAATGLAHLLALARRGRGPSSRGSSGSRRSSGSSSRSSAAGRWVDAWRRPW
ncbi:hypothetical protein BJF90_19545 [Pseudonocardia sp. CNS-004]|nr:hypothetical protein BJF90_19545 [Pseudonocardia sp. CNS-004]